MEYCVLVRSIWRTKFSTKRFRCAESDHAFRMMKAERDRLALSLASASSTCTAPDLSPVDTLKGNLSNFHVASVFNIRYIVQTNGNLMQLPFGKCKL